MMTQPGRARNLARGLGVSLFPALGLLLTLLSTQPGRANPTVIDKPFSPAAPQHATTPPHPVRLLILGDSLTSGYGLAQEEGFQPQLEAVLKQAGWAVEIVDGSVSGDTTAGGRARLDWAMGDGVDAAIVELGGNDGLRGIDPAETAANLQAILDTLTARHVPVLVCGMLAPPNLGPEYGARFQAVFSKLRQQPGVLYDPFFLEGVTLHPERQQPDHIHPNAAGVKVIVARLTPIIEKLISTAASTTQPPQAPQRPEGSKGVSSRASSDKSSQ